MKPYSELTDEELYSNTTIKAIPDIFGFIDYASETSRRFKAKVKEIEELKRKLDLLDTTKGTI
jgi:hypothetical protein